MKSASCPRVGRSIAALLVIVLATAALPLTSAAAVPVTRPTGGEIDRALRELGDAHFDVRERASSILFSAGPRISPRLREAAASGDPEVRFRAESILARFARGVYPDTPADVALMAERYVTAAAEDSQKTTLLMDLGRRGGYGCVVLMKLAAQETDPDLKEMMTRLLESQSSVVGQTASILLAAGDGEAAEHVLETAAEGGGGGSGGGDIAVRAYAAFLLDQHKLDARIAELQLRADHDRVEAIRLGRTLAYFYRAAGDLDRATTAAERAGDGELLETLALERRDWRRLAAIVQERRSGGSEGARRLGFLAAAQRLAGDDAASGKTLKEARGFIEEEAAGSGGSYLTVAGAMLLNERMGDAVELFIEHKNYASAMEFLWYGARYGDALALVDRARTENNPELPKLLATAARIHGRLGQKSKAVAALDEAEALARQRRNFAAYVMLAEAERDLGRSDPAIAARAKNHELAALDAAGANDSLPWLFEKHYPRRGLAANQWWEILLTGRSDDPGAKQTALETLDELLNGRLTRPQWEQALAGAHEEAAGRPLDAPRRIRRLQLAIDSLQSAGQLEQLAAAEFEKLSDLYSWAQTVRREDYLYGAEWHLKHGEPLRALALYDECMARHGGSSDLFWLRGYALEQAGDRAHGAELMEQARQLTLGDERRMALLADAMAAHGHSEDAIGVRRAILRLGQPRGWTWYDECKNLGNALARAGQSAAAADHWQLFAFQVPDNGGAYTDELAYIQLPQVVRRHRARGLYEAGKLPEAMAELRAYLAVAPTDISLAISAVPELKRLGHEGAARELFGLVYGKLDALCRENPDSAFFNNELAWLALKCDYEPAAAFAHASRAVELEPRDTNAMDTLAEAYFRRGDRDRAVQLMKRCEELEPQQPRHAQRREQFEKGTPSSQPTTRPAAE